MKIAVASDNGILLTGHIGRCNMFLVYETIKDNIIGSEKRINNFTLHKTDGHTHNHGGNEHNHQVHSHSALVKGLQDCSYLICSSCGPGLVNDLMSSGIKIILTDEMEADEAVKLLIEGRLEDNPEKVCKGHHN